MNSDFDDSSTAEDTVNHTVSNLTNVFILPQWSINTYIGIFVVVTVFAVTGNGLVLMVEHYNKKKTSTDWLVIFMAGMDLACVVINILSTTVRFNGYWTLIGSDALCGTAAYLNGIAGYSSSLLLTVTALDRYFKTCRPHSTVFSPKRTMRICMGVTLWSILFCIPLILVTRFDKYRQCRFAMMSNAGVILKVFTFAITISYIVMFLIVAIAYTKIGFVLKRKLNRVSVIDVQVAATFQGINAIIMTGEHKLPSIKPKNCPVRSPNTDANEGTSQGGLPYPPTGNQGRFISADQSRQKDTNKKQMNRTTVMMFFITAIFVLSWIPVWTIAILWSNREVSSVQDNIVSLFVRKVYFVNLVSNPVIYVSMSSKFRHKSKVVLIEKCQSFRRLLCR